MKRTGRMALAGLGVVVGLALLRVTFFQEFTYDERWSATACAAIQGTVSDLMVEERLTRMALQTRLATVTPQSALASEEQCTPDATLVCAATFVAEVVQSLQTRVYRLEDAAAQVGAAMATALAAPTAWMTPTPGPTDTPAPTHTPTASGTQTPRPTWTPDVLPSATPTGTPDPLCYACSATNQTCPDNVSYYCRECAAGKWRCVRRSQPASDCQACLAAALATEATPSARMLARGQWLDRRWMTR